MSGGKKKILGSSPGTGCETWVEVTPGLKGSKGLKDLKGLKGFRVTVLLVDALRNLFQPEPFWDSTKTLWGRKHFKFPGFLSFSVLLGGLGVQDLAQPGLSCPSGCCSSLTPLLNS